MRNHRPELERRRRHDMPSLGPCCVCEKVGPSVRNVVTIGRRSPTPGRGWGCFACGLPPHGAIAVVCDTCLGKPGQEIALRFVCIGYPGDGERLRYEELDPTPFEHDPAVNHARA